MVDGKGIQQQLLSITVFACGLKAKTQFNIGFCIVRIEFDNGFKKLLSVSLIQCGEAHGIFPRIRLQANGSAKRIGGVRVKQVISLQDVP